MAANVAKRVGTVLAWCPPAYRALNAELLRKKHLLPARKAMIAAQIATDERRRLAAMTDFERQMERLANGAQLVEVVPMRRALPERTLGGVSGGML